MHETVYASTTNLAPEGPGDIPESEALGIQGKPAMTGLKSLSKLDCHIHERTLLA